MKTQTASTGTALGSAVPSTAPSSTSKKMTIAGWVLSAIPGMMLLSGGLFALTKAPMVLEGVGRLGYPASTIVGIGLAELACALLYLIPRTSVLGAILMTGYLGGATASHVRISDPFIGPILFGVVVWAGLYLRDSRVRALLPLRK